MEVLVSVLAGVFFLVLVASVAVRRRLRNLLVGPSPATGPWAVTEVSRGRGVLNQIQFSMGIDPTPDDGSGLSDLTAQRSP
jgi:hypothetical protein